MQMLRYILIFFAIGPCAMLAPSAAAPSCIYAAAQAEARHGIPDKLLQAITIVETGRTLGDIFTPWPWTTNADEKSRYFRSKADGLQFVKNHLYAGKKSIDIGCFQINTKWHGEHFNSIEDMFDPGAGADYAARFLVKLKDEFGDWETAATKYHSRTPVYANRYGQKLAAVRRTLVEERKAPILAPAVLAPPLREGSPVGGVRLTIFAKAQPIVERARGPLLMQGASLGER